MPRLSQAQLRQALRQPSEKALQRDVVQLLEGLGYTVMITGQPSKRACCPKCHTFFHVGVGTGNSVGTPDLYVAHRDTGNHWIGCECKAPGADSLLGTLQPGRIRPEQKKLVELGVSNVITDVQAALELVKGLRK